MNPTGQIKAFISYAREDAAFVDLLIDALRQRSIDVWLDRRDIAAAEDWLQRIAQGITEAAFFLFVVSPDSTTSEICGVELRQAVALNKPLIPVLRRAAPLPTVLESVQWADFSNDEAFQSSIVELEAVLRRDPQWFATHALLSTDAAIWQQRGEAWFALLHGGAIADAERWLAEADGERRRATALERRYIQASRRFSRRWRVFAVCAVIAAVAVMSILGYFQQRSARADAARDLAARAVQLRNTDQSALEASTLMLIAASRRLAALGLPSPDIDAMLRESARLLLPAVREGQHPGGVGGVAVAPSGRLIATYAYSRTASVSGLWQGRTDATVRVWDVPSAVPFAVLPHQSMASAAAFAGDQHLVTGTIDGTLSFWEVEQLRAPSPSPVATHALGSPIVHLVAATERAFTAAAESVVCAWNVSNGSRLWCVNDANGKGILLLALSPDGEHIAAAGERGVVTLRHARTGQTTATMRQRSGSAVTTLSFSPGSNQLVAGDASGEMNLWAIPSGTNQLSLSHRDRVSDVAYSQPGSRGAFIATASTDASLRLINQHFSTFRIDEFRFDYALWLVAIDPSARFVAVARGDGYVDLWSREEQRLAGRFRIQSRDVATGLSFVSSDQLVVTDGGDGVHFLNVPAAREPLPVDSAQGVDRLTVSAKGLVLATDAFGATATLAVGSQRLEPVSLPLPSIAASAFAAGGDRLAVVDEETNELKVYSVAGDVLTEAMHWPVPQNIGAMAWHPLQDKIAIAKRDGGVWMYDAGTGSEVSSVQPGGNRLSYAPAGEWLAIVTPGEGLKLWNWASKTAPLIIDRTADVVDALFSPTAPVLFTAHRDRTIRRWAVTTSGTTATLEERWLTDFCPDDKVLALSTAGTVLAAGCQDDGRVRLWSAAGTALSDVRYPGKLRALEFSADGRMLMVAGERGLKTFVIAGTDLIHEACSRISRNFSLSEWQRTIGGACERLCSALPGCQ